ncbi:hypothetical protein SCATT_14360 [Streptantibioticus cattleyicolor NRRL 8057 = DSM 46488]|uniref:Uncharacterized protein n=1 Tax=Streptantibioticus cattleyicolor (strain ATCC 35852 / DSM 46488 / JCM 4925 / NBRC 14057 / NRRL 8057) TaxID=1003195 RepID=G8WZ58_STREN|nr:hypothetical protein SCATT_14360 [Streptantibioticus cattleyicolor NRRL 8057 = DSM 46488]
MGPAADGVRRRGDRTYGSWSRNQVASSSVTRVCVSLCEANLTAWKGPSSSSSSLIGV